MEPITTSLVAVYVADKLLAQFIKDEGYSRVRLLFIPKENYKSRLTNILLLTIDEFEKKYPFVKTLENKKIPFYKSKVAFEELSKFILFKTKENSVVVDKFQKDERIIVPHQKQIEEFFALFYINVKKDKKLKKIFIESNYKEEIFRISEQFEQFSLSIQKIHDKLKVVGEGIDKIINDINPELELEWKRQIEVYKENLNQFKPRTALELLLELETSFESSIKKPSKAILATIEYLKGQCFEYLQKSEDAYKAYVKAYRLSENSIVFMEKACWAYYKLEEKEEANKLIPNILQIHEYNYIAWAVKLLILDNADLTSLCKDVPKIVMKDKNFRRIIFFNTRDLKFSNQNIFFEENQIFLSLSECSEAILSTDNYKDKIFCMESLLHRFTSRYFIDFTRVNEGNKEILIAFNKVSKAFIDCIDNSEIKNNFQTIRFFNLYSDFILNKNSEVLIEMKKLLSSLNHSSDYPTIIVANSLQLTGKTDDALLVLKGLENKNFETLLLESFCFYKKGDWNNYVSKIKEALAAIEAIDSYSIDKILPMICTLNDNKKLDNFELKDFLEGKQIKSNYLGLLIECLFNTFKSHKNEPIVKLLKSIENEVLESKLEIVFFVPYCYFYLKEYDFAIEVFRKYISKDSESKDLFYYLLCLSKSESNHNELLLLLQKWRKEFSFNPGLLSIECEIKRLLFDWGGCLEIADFLIEKQPLDEYFLTIQLMSVSQLEREDKRKRIEELSVIFESYEFTNYLNLQIVIDILYQHGFPKIALNIIYKKAIEKDNKQARMDYFFMTIKMPRGIINEKEIIEAGSYVSYLFEGEVKFIIAEEFNQFKDFIGKRKGEIITRIRPILNIVDTFQIIRVMDKYLSLHDEILEEIKNDPYSGYPMQSFNAEAGTYEGINETLTNLFGANGSILKAKLQTNFKDYYAFNISFTEIVILNYSSEYFGGYFDLVHRREGITQIPFYNYPKFNLLNKEAEIVIDISSLIILFQIYSVHKVKYPSKFIIAKSVVEKLKFYLKKERIDKEILETESKEYQSKISLNVTLEGVIPIYKTMDSFENNIKYFHNILYWIDENCKVEIAVSKLDILKKLESKHKDEDFMNYVVEYASLLMESQNRVLISDDFIFLKFFPINSGRIYSSEYYIKSALSNNKELLQEFINYKYIGYTHTSEDLYNEFNKRKLGQFNNYYHCLTNTSLRLIPKNETIAVIITFLKRLAQDELTTTEQFGQEATNALVSLLKGQREMAVFKTTEFLIMKEFELLGFKLDIMLQSYSDAIRILGYSN